MSIIVVRLLAKLSASILVATVAISSGYAFFAAQPKHEMCAARQHDCGKTATLKECCCGGGQGAGSNQAGPVESRVQLTPDLAFAPVVFAIAHLGDLSLTRVHIQTSPPRVCPLDPSILFTSLLI